MIPYVKLHDAVFVWAVSYMEQFRAVSFSYYLCIPGILVTGVIGLDNKQRSGFQLDETPMVNSFPGLPDSCFDQVNQFGTYEIQRTADTDNFYPAIAQGLPKSGHFAACSKQMYDLTVTRNRKKHR